MELIQLIKLKSMTAIIIIVLLVIWYLNQNIMKALNLSTKHTTKEKTLKRTDLINSTKDSDFNKTFYNFKN